MEDHRTSDPPHSRLGGRFGRQGPLARRPRGWWPFSAVAAAAAVIALGACQGPAPRRNIVMFEHDGTPLDPAAPSFLGGLLGGYGSLHEDEGEVCEGDPTECFQAYVADIIAGIRAYCRERPERREVVIFIHGGLNTQRGSIGRAIELTPRIEAQADAYPVFINWRSSLLSSYLDHLLFVRQGTRSFGPRNDAGDTFWDALNVLLLPIQLSADLVGAVIRFPIIQLSQWEGAMEWLGRGRPPDREAADSVRHRWERQGEADGLVVVDEFAREPDAPLREHFESGVGAASWFLMSPVRAVTTTIVDAGGTGAWQVMRRRVELLFFRETDLAGRLVHRSPRGLLYFMRRLRDLQHEFEADHARSCALVSHERCRGGLRVSIVGHSMGAIVLNSLLEHALVHEESACEIKLPRIDQVAYLGAACSVIEYERAAFPYLQKHEATNVYHVVLHPTNEMGENTFFDLLPRGSLLAWVDDFLAKPLTPLDRTAGSYSHLLPALHRTPRELRPRVHVRLLPWATDGLPQRHTGFGSELEGFRFWSPASWTPP